MASDRGNQIGNKTHSLPRARLGRVFYHQLGPRLAISAWSGTAYSGILIYPTKPRSGSALHSMPGPGQ